MACKDGQFDGVEVIASNINLNAQHVNGMTHFDFGVLSGKRDMYLLSTKNKIFMISHILASTFCILLNDTKP